MTFVNFLDDLQKFSPKLIENIKSIYLESHDIISETDNYDFGAGILLICPKTKKVLLGLRSDNQEDNGVWCGFGGKAEAGETPMQAAIREVWEEAKIHPKSYIVIKPAIHINQNTDSFKFHNYLGIIDSEIQPMINNEHKDAKWFFISELSTIPLHFGLGTILSDSKKFNIINNYIG